MGNSRDQFQEGMYYHIVNKSFGNTILRETGNDYKTFILQTIDHLMGYPHIKLISYCILPDHFHFVVFNSRRGFDISNFMRKIQISYAMYFKRSHQDNASIKGLPVFKGRFKARKIELEDLDKITSYVNYNPLHHEIVESISNRPYCSVHQLTDTGYDYSQETYIKISIPSQEINIYPNSEIIPEFEIN
ncbi:transposase [Candidatus Gracilibacteria bacterium]|nr:transposase [Candidatus Gracilibacteria bacterium]